MTAFKKLSIFFPMWNEEDYLGRALGAAAEACEALLAMGEIGDYELIVVDDASTDATGRLADEAAERDPRIIGPSTTRRTASSAGRSRPGWPRRPATSSSTPTPTCPSTWTS